MSMRAPSSTLNSNIRNLGIASSHGNSPVFSGSIGPDRERMALVRDRDSEFGSSGSLVRKYFFISISVANTARLISIIIMLILTQPHRDLIQCSGECLKILFICRVIPTSLYLTMFSLLTVFLAQLHHTVSGLPFFRVRFLWFFGNLLLYMLLLIFLALMPSFIFWLFFWCSFIILCCICLYSMSIYNHLQAPMLISSPSSTKIISRFVPVVGICSIALLIGSVYYFCMATRLVADIYSYPLSSIIFDLIAFGSMEIIPSLVIVFFLAYRKEVVKSSPSESNQISYMSTGIAGHHSQQTHAASSSSSTSTGRKPPLAQSHIFSNTVSNSYKPIRDEVGGGMSSLHSENI